MIRAAYRRTAIAALLLSVHGLAACDGDAVTGDAMPPASPPSQEPALPAPDPLASWFSGGFAGKKVVFWGNSTVSQAVYFFDRLRTHAVPGGALDGLDPARIFNYGSNGASLAALLNGGGAYPIDSVISAQPDLLVIRGPLINDVRLGATSLETARQLLASMLERIHSGSPRTAILLTTENSLLTADVGNHGYVQPNGAAQQYTDLMRAAVLAMDGRYPNLRVVDVMKLEYGTVCIPSSLLMWDQLHPSDTGQQYEADILVAVIGAGHQDPATVPVPARPSQASIGAANATGL